MSEAVKQWEAMTQRWEKQRTALEAMHRAEKEHLAATKEILSILRRMETPAGTVGRSFA